MDERLRFVARLLDGEKMAPLCREFDISRKTGYKIFNRYKDIGLDGLSDRTRRPMRYANQLPFQVESKIVQLKKGRLNWGAPKIRERLRKLHPGIPLPAISTCMRCWIATAWSNDAGANGSKHKAHPFHDRPHQTICGVPIIRASSCSPTGATVIR
jgi:hypothetical protein